MKMRNNWKMYGQTRHGIKILSVWMVVLLSWMMTPMLSAQQQGMVVGTWKGTLEAAKLDLYFTVVEQNEGLSATLTVPAQGAVDLPVDRITFDGMNLTLEMDALMLNYSGMLMRGAFHGTFSQYGAQYPMSLVKAEIPRPSRPQEPQPPYPYESQEVRFWNERDSIKLAGTLTYPAGDGVFDAVILVSGSGPQDRNEELMNHRPFLVLADALTRAGYAVLRYDDRGVGASGGVFAGATTHDFSYDAQSALSFLASLQKSSSDGLPRIGRVGMLGHSEGAAIAFLVAARDSTCDFVISFGGPGVRGDEILLSQQREIMRQSGFTATQLDQLSAFYRQVYDVILASSANDEVLRQEITALLGDPSATAQLLDPWMYEFIRFSPEQTLQAVRVPVLALNGSKDLQVIAALNLPAIGAALNAGGNTAVTLLELEGLNHLGQHCETGHPNEYAVIEETIAPEVIAAILEFL